MKARITIGTAIFAIAGVALAQGPGGWGERPERPDRGERPPPPPEEVFAMCDANDDGVLDPDEFRGPAEAFERIDADGDGYLAPEELEAAGPPPRRGPGMRGERPERGDGPPPPPEDRFAMDDANGDGVLDPDEFRGPAEAFERIDADGDGYLALEELEAAGPPPGRGPGMRGEGPERGDGPPPPPEDRFAMDDANGDGVLDPDEFRGPAEAFERIDADGDGYLTPEELKAVGPPTGPPPGERQPRRGGPRRR